ncbi:MAG: SAM-dependent methyltransferase, partial [Armatimonadetes bacterium]|nr:SAM-dependent methyltransferase [Armatimonadota bacterium]
DAMQVHIRQLSEGLITGLSRPTRQIQVTGPVLGNYASVLRGIATGGNEFFFMTKKQASLLGIPAEFLRSAVGRTRDVDGNELTEETMAALDAAGRPTLLLSLDGRPMNAFPPAIQEYLREGEKAGLPEKALISQRRPWYKMEVRRVPPFLFAYLGRRNTRFIRNLAGVVPLTGFLCVYPHKEETSHLQALWRILQDPETIENLSYTGKSYGSGAIKVEPRALEQLRLPSTPLLQSTHHQLELF